MSKRWTTPADIATKVRRRWDDGSLLRSHAGLAPFEPIEVPIAGPRAAEIGDHYGAVLEWITQLDAGRHDDRRYTLLYKPIGGRDIGRNQIPFRAVVSTPEQAFTLLGVRTAVGRFDEILAITKTEPLVRTWALRYPQRALELHGEMPALVAAHTWLAHNRDSGRYLREISAPGVDTKFAERHRQVLAATLGVSATAAGFVRGLGLRTKPEYVRLRPASWVGLPAALSEVTVRAEELAALTIRPRRALVIENEITYLSVEVPTDGVVIWGKGFEVDRIGRLPWLAETEVTYWGDLDTYGFAILDRLRRWLPQTRSVLMDRQTLLAHRDRWVTEQKPTTVTLGHLTDQEQEVYAELVTGVYADRVRLEQERVDWGWAQQRLHSLEA